MGETAVCRIEEALCRQCRHTYCEAELGDAIDGLLRDDNRSDRPFIVVNVFQNNLERILDIKVIKNMSYMR